MKTNNKKKTKKTVQHEVVVKVQAIPINTPTESELADPVKDGGKYMIPKTWMSERQVVRLVQKTPQQHIYKRPAKGGGTWSYVMGSYVEKVLNFTFGWNWDFEIIKEEEKYKQVIVLGRLTVKDDKGHAIAKMQAGRADIKFKRGSNEPLDYGNDVKAAATDSLKKCASLLGIASDVYGKAEYKQETGTDVSAAALPAPSNGTSYVATDDIIDYVCSKCGNDITKQEGEYSKKMFGKMLCRDDQKKAK